MSLFAIPSRRFTDARNEIVPAIVEAAAQDALKNGVRCTGGMRLSYSTIDDAREAMQRSAEHERWEIADKIARNVAHERKLAEDEAEARRIAAEHQFNIETLTFEVERRNFGSFTTTRDGSPERQAIFVRALEIARAEQRSHHMEAAE